MKDWPQGFHAALGRTSDLWGPSAADVPARLKAVRRWATALPEGGGDEVLAAVESFGGR